MADEIQRKNDKTSCSASWYYLTKILISIITLHPRAKVLLVMDLRDVKDVVASSEEISILTFAWRGYERRTKKFNHYSRSQSQYFNQLAGVPRHLTMTFDLQLNRKLHKGRGSPF
jgi:hypothetical protein